MALVGYGLGGSAFHAPLIDADPRLELGVVITSDPHRRDDVRRRYPRCRVLGRFEDLLTERRDIRLVVISAPNSVHVALASAALEHGFDVVVDKPLAPSAVEAEELVRLARSAGRVLVPYHNRRWDGDFLTVAKLLEEGRLGAVHRFESRFERWQPRNPNGSERSWKRRPGPGQATGILYDLGTHLVDQAVHLFGRPEAVYAEVAVRRPGAAVDDDAFVALRHPGGVTSHLWASCLAAEPGPRFRIMGSGGAYVKWGMDVQEAALVSGGRPGRPGWGEEATTSWGTVSGGEVALVEPTVAGSYQEFYARMAACLLEGAPVPVEALDAVTVASVIEAAVTSAAGSRVVSMVGADSERDA